MVAKVIMPTARIELKSKIESFLSKTSKSVEIVSLYGSLTSEEITRQHIVFISNTCPKVIKPNDKVFLLAVDHPVLMAMLTVRIMERLRVLHGASRRRWYILWYNRRSKELTQYYLP